jgi:hypothetical protein
MDSFSDFFWVLIAFFVAMAALVVLFHVVLDLFRDHTISGAQKALWALFLVLVPLLSSLVYLVTRGSGMTERNKSVPRADQQAAGTFAQSVATGHVVAE